MRAITADKTATERYRRDWNGGRKHGCRGESTHFDHVWSLPWPLGLAMGFGVFLVTRSGALWLLSPQKSSIAQRSNKGISTTLTPTAWMALVVYRLAAFVWVVGSYLRHKLLNTCATENLCAADWRQLELMLGEAFGYRSIRWENWPRRRGRPHQLDFAGKRLDAISAAQETLVA